MDWLDFEWSPQLITVASVAIAAIMGGIVGIEREQANKPAGLRTHAVLASAACLLVELSSGLIGHFMTDATKSVLQADPIRVVEAIVTGTAFLGAGTIFVNRQESGVEGLTTAASLLLVAAIGISVAVGQIIVAIGVTALAWFLLRIARHLWPEDDEDDVDPEEVEQPDH